MEQKYSLLGKIIAFLINLKPVYYAAVDVITDFLVNQLKQLPPEYIDAVKRLNEKDVGEWVAYLNDNFGPEWTNRPLPESVLRLLDELDQDTDLLAHFWQVLWNKIAKLAP